MSAAPNYQGVCLPDGSGERHTGSVEVSGSIPLCSTKAEPLRKGSAFSFCQKSSPAMGELFVLSELQAFVTAYPHWATHHTVPSAHFKNFSVPLSWLPLIQFLCLFSCNPVNFHGIGPLYTPHKGCFRFAKTGQTSDIVVFRNLQKSPATGTRLQSRPRSGYIHKP